MTLHPLRSQLRRANHHLRSSLGCLRRFHLRARVGTTVAPLAWRPGLVRGLLRYHGPVRLPVVVHRRRTSLDFTARPGGPSSPGDHGTSRFPRKVFPYVLGVSDRAGSGRTSRYRCAGCDLPLLLTASASRSEVLSRLNTRPARTPVNASRLPSRTATHDSGPLWVASPSTYDSFIHNTSPVLTGAQGASQCTTPSKS